jgi:hypothetical protein
MVTTIEQKDSYTHFNVNGIILKTWTIVGGAIAVSFNDFSFSERLGNKKGYEDGKLNQCPEISDFKNGVATLIDFVNRNLPKKQLREKRYKEILTIVPYTLKSKRFHDTENGCYFYCKLEFKDSYISPVTVTSACYAGRCDSTIDKFSNEKWIALRNYFNPLFDTNVKIENLSEKKFNDMKNFLTKIT